MQNRHLKVLNRLERNNIYSFATAGKGDDGQLRRETLEGIRSLGKKYYIFICYRREGI